MGKHKKSKSNGKISQKGRNHCAIQDSGVKGKTTQQSNVSERTRSKRSIETTVAEGAEQQPPKRVKLTQSVNETSGHSEAREPQFVNNQDSNNNATIRSDLQAPVIVGSTKSLIDSIKNRQRGKRTDPPLNVKPQPGPSHEGNHRVTKKPSVAKGRGRKNFVDQAELDQYDKFDV